MDNMPKVKCVVYCEIKKRCKQNCKEDSLLERGYEKKNWLKRLRRHNSKGSRERRRGEAGGSMLLPVCASCFPSPRSSPIRPGVIAN